MSWFPCEITTRDSERVGGIERRDGSGDETFVPLDETRHETKSVSVQRNEMAVHRRGSMQLPARLKSLKRPKAIAQIRPGHETQRFKDKSK